MGLLETLVGKIDLKEIEAKALEAKEVQEAILRELKGLRSDIQDLSRKVSILVYAAEVYVRKTDAAGGR